MNTSNQLSEVNAIHCIKINFSYCCLVPLVVRNKPNWSVFEIKDQFCRLVCDICDGDGFEASFHPWQLSLNWKANPPA